MTRTRKRSPSGGRGGGASAASVAAPVLRGGSMDRLATAAYALYREHHGECPQCGQQNYYEPEQAALCRTGRFRFGRWLAASGVHPPALPKGQRWEADDE